MTKEEYKKIQPIMNAWLDGSDEVEFYDYQNTADWIKAEEDIPNKSINLSSIRIKRKIKFPEEGDIYRDKRENYIVIIPYTSCESSSEDEKQKLFVLGGRNGKIFNLYSNKPETLDRIYEESIVAYFSNFVKNANYDL